MASRERTSQIPVGRSPACSVAGTATKVSELALRMRPVGSRLRRVVDPARSMGGRGQADQYPSYA
jgi:hypothetical protein